MINFSHSNQKICKMQFGLRIKGRMQNLISDQFSLKISDRAHQFNFTKNADFPIKGQKVVQKQKAAAESGRCFQFTSSAELRLFMEASRAAFLDSVASSLRCKSSSSDSKQLAFDFHCDSSLSTVACKFLSKFSCKRSKIFKALEVFF